MTTKVVKGSLWTLAGQVAPLAVSLVATPFVIRLLGAESYGVLILIGLIPTYLGFADFGMSMASTKFGSEAYAEGDEEKEARIVRTAALIALMTSVPVAAALIIFASPVIALFNVPEALQAEAVTALRIAAVTFVINFLCGIFNTPQLARLRMDLNTFINAGSRILGLIATPIVLYLGYGIIGAVTVLLAASLLNLLGHLIVSRKLLPHLVGSNIERTMLRPIAKFGGGLVVAVVAGSLLMHVEKIVLTAMTTVETLAHYSVAFTLSTMATMFAAAMMQALVPAFSQLLGPGKKKELSGLFTRALRLNVILMLPCLTALFVIAQPFFTIWAGEEFGRESTFPFQILLFGLFFSIVAYVPLSLLIADGRTALIAKLYWFELIPYIGLIVVFTSLYGAAGAAFAYCVRVIADAIVVGILSYRGGLVSIEDFQSSKVGFFLVFLAFAPSIIFSIASNQFSSELLALLILGLGIYPLIIWKNFIENSEKLWIRASLRLGLSSMSRVLR